MWEKATKGVSPRQRAAAAFDTRRPNGAQRRTCQEISDTFEKYRDSDFGRKLYLIQNSIFGVDKQPVACQIARLRFFISLAIEQEPTEDAGDNYGIKPLPNLETRFVAADTLLAMQNLAATLTSERTRDIQRELQENRERHFHTTSRRDKLACRKKDRELREMLAESLEEVGLPAGDAGRIAQWDPYDQNARADWFSAEYMFGVADNFDIVMANPPYVRQELIKPAAYKNALVSQYSDAAGRRSDLYCYFYARDWSCCATAGYMYSSAPTVGWMWATVRSCSIIFSVMRISAQFTKAR